MSQPPSTEPEVVRYCDRPELWDSLGDLSSKVWPEYNLHGDVLGQYWDQLYTTFPEWQFALFDPGAGQVLAEGHTIPVAWDGSDAGLGPGIDASLAAGFALRAAGGTPSAVCALAAEIPPHHQGRGLSPIMLRAMAGLAASAGLAHLIAPVRPNLKEQYPTIPIERYVGWTRDDGTPFDPAKALPFKTRKRPDSFTDRDRSPPSTSTGQPTAALSGNQTSGSSTLPSKHEIAAGSCTTWRQGTGGKDLAAVQADLSQTVTPGGGLWQSEGTTLRTDARAAALTPPPVSAGLYRTTMNDYATSGADQAAGNVGGANAAKKRGNAQMTAVKAARGGCV